mmetsp:Transcript_37559/g.94819  ORF Transcript_37559/g.94819 Transcript_37559/m.94819 type:complete len:221 (+) Transcript_37559:566-1228(+)
MRTLLPCRPRARQQAAQQALCCPQPAREVRARLRAARPWRPARPTAAARAGAATCWTLWCRSATASGSACPSWRRRRARWRRSCPRRSARWTGCVPTTWRCTRRCATWSATARRRWRARAARGRAPPCSRWTTRGWRWRRRVRRRAARATSAGRWRLRLAAVRRAGTASAWAQAPASPAQAACGLARAPRARKASASLRTSPTRRRAGPRAATPGRTRPR